MKWDFIVNDKKVGKASNIIFFNKYKPPTDKEKILSELNKSIKDKLNLF